MSKQLEEALCNIALSCNRIERGQVEVIRRLDALKRQEARQKAREDRILANLSDVKAAVAAEKTVVQSAITLLTELKTKLDAAIASGDPAEIQAVVDEIGAQTNDLATNVALNTPAA